MLNDHISRIQLLIDHNKLDDAQIRVLESLAEFPDTASLYNLQASIHIARKEYNKALTAAETAIGLEPVSDYNYYQKAEILLVLNRFKEAHEAIDMAIAFYPENGHYFGLQATLFLRQEKKSDAISSARQGLSKNPDDPLCANVLSLALGSTGKVAEAGLVLEGQLERDPENAFTQASTGYNYLRENNIEKAKEHFQAALMIDPESSFAKSGMVEAIKASNPLYRKILQYGVWMEKKSEKARWAIIIGLVVVVKLLPILAIPYLVLVFSVWFIPPFAEMLVYRDKHGRYLLSQEERLINQVNSGLFFFALVAAVILAPLINLAFLGSAAGAFFAIPAIYGISLREKPLNRMVMVGFALLFIGAGVMSLTMALAGGSMMPGMTVLFIAVIAFTWLSNMFSK